VFSMPPVLPPLLLGAGAFAASLGEKF